MTDTVLGDDAILSFFAAALAKVHDVAPQAPLALSATLRDDLGLDSFAALELLFEIEDRTGIRIPQEAATQFQTVSDVVAFVRSAMTASADRMAATAKAMP